MAAGRVIPDWAVARAVVPGSIDQVRGTDQVREAADRPPEIWEIFSAWISPCDRAPAHCRVVPERVIDRTGRAMGGCRTGRVEGIAPTVPAMGCCQIVLVTGTGRES